MRKPHTPLTPCGLMRPKTFAEAFLAQDWHGGSSEPGLPCGTLVCNFETKSLITPKELLLSLTLLACLLAWGFFWGYFLFWFGLLVFVHLGVFGFFFL